MREEADMTGSLEQTNSFRRQGADDILRVMASLWKEFTIVQNNSSKKKFGLEDVV